MATSCLSFAANQQNDLTRRSGSIVLSQEEQTWLENHPSLTIALDDTNPPMNFRREDGEFSGISVEYLRLIGEKIGIIINFQGSTWAQALRKALDHNVDGIMTASIKEDRKPFLNFTEPYVTTPEALATRKDFKKVESLSDLDGMSIAVVRGTIRIDIVKESCPNGTVIEVESPEEGIKLLSEGKVTAFFDDVPVVQHAIESNLLTNLKIPLLYYSDAGAARVGLRNDQPELLSIFNKAIDAISDEEHRKIRNKWYATSNDTTVEYEFKLSDKEKSWLKDHPTIRVATDPGWRPIEFQDTDGEYKGISIDYLRRIERRLGVRFEILKGYSWAELIEKAQARELDMFSSVTATPDRENYLLFTEPYLSFPGAIFTRYDSPYIGNLKELENKKVAVVKGYAFHELLKLNYPEVNLVPVASTQTGLQVLEEGKVAAYVDNLLVASFYISTRGSISLKVAGETPFRNDLSFATRSDWPEFAGIMQKALDSLSQEDKRQIYKRWVSLSYEQKFDKKLVLQIIASFTFVFICTLIVIQWRQLKSRNKSMQEISRRTAEFESVFNAMTDALVMTDTARRIVMVNKAFVDIFGYNSEEVKGYTTESLYADPEEFRRLGETRFSSEAQIDQPIFEVDYRRKDGSVFPGETVGVKIQVAPDTLIGYLGVIRDITKRKRATEELLNYRDNLQALVNEQTLELKEAHAELLQKERLATLGQLTASVSHELRNPLGTIQVALFTFVESLEQKDPTRATRSIELAERSINRCVSIIEDLNDFARVKELDISSAPVDDWLRVVFDEQSIPEGVSCELDLASGVEASFDQEKLRQVAVNLINNAVHALQDQKKKRKLLRISTRSLGSKYEIRFEDSGVGMPEEVKERIFEPLYSTKGFGVGLGMVIVENIIERHHGELDIESAAGEGTTVTLRLPVNLLEELKVS
jgi:PAS domain S-box-containing protein